MIRAPVDFRYDGGDDGWAGRRLDDLEVRAPLSSQRRQVVPQRGKPTTKKSGKGTVGNTTLITIQDVPVTELINYMEKTLL